MFDARIGTRPLADLCRRVSTSLSAGIDTRRNWQREAENARGSARQPMEHIRESVSRGQTLVDALQSTGQYFPALFHEMVAVGEETGHLAEVLRRLAQHYDHQLEMKKAFRQSISGPMFQLGFALFIVGLLIWITGFIASMQGRGAKPLDLLGFGLVGNEGLKTYLLILGSIAFALWFLYYQVQRGVFWTGWLQRIAMQIPKIGRSLELLALSRFSWSLHLALETEMALRRALRLAFLSTRNAFYTQHIDDVLQRIRDGNEITETLASARAFPTEFLDAVRVGEQTGQLAETLGVLSEHYQEEGRAAVRMLTRAAGGLVWLMVTGLIVMLIFRLFGFYMQQLNDALKGAGM